MKLDIEGAETDVLMDAKEMIAQCVKNMFFEWHSTNKIFRRLGELLTFFGRYGFRYHIQEAVTRKTPFENRNQDRRMDSQLNCNLYRNYE